MQRVLWSLRPLLRASVPAGHNASRPRSARSFTSTSPLAINSRRVAGRVKIVTIDDKLREFTLDEKIESPQIRLKQPDGILSEPQYLFRVLESIDRSTHFVMQLGQPSEGEAAIARIVTRADLVQKINDREAKQRNSKKAEKEKRPKQLELNWAISENDLALKMKQMEEFLKKGKKVQLLLASKRHQRRASPEEAEKLLKTVRERMTELGAIETAPMEGGILRQAILTVKIPDR